MTANSNGICLEKDQLQEHSKELAELEAKSAYKEQRINELIENNKRIESKIDNLTETVNAMMVASIKDDNDLKTRVTALETKIETQEATIAQYEEKNRKERNEDRQKTNLYLAFITCGIGVLSFILAYALH